MTTRVTGTTKKEREFVQSGKLTWLAIGLMGSALLTGAASWLAFGQDKVTRQEMTDYVADRSVRAVDFVRVEEVVKKNAEHIATLQASVKELARSLNTFFREQTRRDGKWEATIDVIRHAIADQKGRKG